MKTPITFWHHKLSGSYPETVDIEFVKNDDPRDFTVEFLRDFSCSDEVHETARAATRLLLSGQIQPGCAVV